MIRVLQVYPQINNAGTERVIINLYENIDTSVIQFDFLVEKKGELDNKIKQMGGKIYYLDEKNKFNYYKRLKLFFLKHPEYKIVHTHTHARMGIVLKAAKNSKVPFRIAHSHNARNDLPKIASFIKGCTSIPIEKSANYFFACSQNAAAWLFPHKTKKCRILYNGIKLDDYLYDVEKRNEKRKELNIETKDFVMINVGRFAKQKNHKYLVEIFNEYNKCHNSNWKAILVGDGPLQDDVKKQVEDCGLLDHVIFLNNRNDVNELLSAGDMFVFPSLHEGLGIVVIEAQASGLPCVVSNAVPEEADMEVGLLHTLKLEDEFAIWCTEIDTCKVSIEERNRYKNSILQGKYNIEKIASYMQNFYIGLEYNE
ncbi:MAG: glycosyltransferase [Lachnospiraceae bacterium]|nr:glycosyltransferase [Lachnospiraceae bacterium]